MEPGWAKGKMTAKKGIRFHFIGTGRLAWLTTLYDCYLDFDSLSSDCDNTMLLRRLIWHSRVYAGALA